MNVRLAECEASLPLEALAPELAAQELACLRTLDDRQRAQLRAHAYVLIRRALGCRPDQAWISYGACGRPVVNGSGVNVSISHKHSRVCVAMVDDTHQIGVDLEHLREPINTTAFARFAFGPSEREEIARMSARGWSPQETMIAFWSAKESYCKSAGYPLRPLDLSLRFTHGLCGPGSPEIGPATAPLSAEARPPLKRFLDERGLTALDTLMERRGDWVRTVTAMRHSHSQALRVGPHGCSCGPT